MIVVHHLEKSRSQRVLWLLEELGLDYEIVRYQRDAATMLAPPELRKVHRLGKSPVIVDGGTTMAESGAIIEYLVERYGEGRLRPPAGTPQRLRYLYWLHYAEGSLMPPLLMKLVFDRLPRSPMPFFVRPIAKAISAGAKSGYVMPQLALHLDHLEAELAEQPWFAGEAFSAADIQLSYPVEAAASRAGFGATRPRLQGWLDRIHARPAYAKAMARCGDFGIPS